MKFDIQNLRWTQEPKSCVITQDRIEIVTKPHTDLWQRTYYHFRNDNAPVLQMDTEETFFSFLVKTEFSESHHRFDQCGVVLYLDSENWLKGSVEYENENFQHLGSVVTNHGYSDWATTEIPAHVKSMWYRLSRREDDFCIEYLHGRTIVGECIEDSGPDGMHAAGPLADALARLGLRLRRFKTGTPPRVNRRSIDFSKMQLQPGDDDALPFSFETAHAPENRAVCYLTYTTEETHRIIRENLDRSPIYAGVIEGIGPRY